MCKSVLLLLRIADGCTMDELRALWPRKIGSELQVWSQWQFSYRHKIKHMASKPYSSMRREIKMNDAEKREESVRERGREA